MNKNTIVAAKEVSNLTLSFPLDEETYFLDAAKDTTIDGEFCERTNIVRTRVFARLGVFPLGLLEKNGQPCDVICHQTLRDIDTGEDIEINLSFTNGTFSYYLNTEAKRDPALLVIEVDNLR